MSAPVLQIQPKTIRGSYTPRGGVPRGFYWDPSKMGSEVRLDPEPPPLRINAILDRPVIEMTPPVSPKHGSLYYDATRSALMMYDGTRHIPISSAPATGDEKRGPWCVGPCHTCGVQTRSFREPTDTRPIYCGDCPNPHNVGGAKCLVEACRTGIFEGEMFCSDCVKDPVIWSSLLGGLGALCLAVRGTTLVLSVPHNLQVFYLIGMLLIAVKAVRMILKGARGR